MLIDKKELIGIRVIDSIADEINNIKPPCFTIGSIKNLIVLPNSHTVLKIFFIVVTYPFCYAAKHFLYVNVAFENWFYNTSPKEQ